MDASDSQSPHRGAFCCVGAPRGRPWHGLCKQWPMSPATDGERGGGDRNRADFGGATVLDGATYQLPDGRTVRAFVHAGDDPLASAVRVTLHTAEEWATDDLPYYTLDRTGRVMRQSWSRNAWAHPTPWTAADLGPGDAAGWDAAVRWLGAEPWLPVDRFPVGPPPAAPP